MVQKEVSEAASKLASLGGKKRAQVLSAERRMEISRKASAARWPKNHTKKRKISRSKKI